MSEKSLSKRVKGYQVEATTDMTGHGFRKELIWRDIVDDGDRWFITDYHFSVDRFSCYTCKTADFTWLVPQRTGVYKVCLGCQTATGPITMEDAMKIGDAKEITPEEVRDIYISRGLTRLPYKLVMQLRQRASRVKRGKPRPDIETF